MAQDVLVALVTCPPDKSEAIAQGLAEDRVAACVNVVPSWAAFYITFLIQQFWYSAAQPWVDAGRPF